MDLWLNKKAGFAALTVLLAAGSIYFSDTSAQAAETQKQDPAQEISQALLKQGGTVFPLGSPNTAYEKYFTGKSYIALLSKGGVPVYNVTFDQGAHTYWHIHHKTCQILVAESGRGYYQIWGEPAKELHPGETVTIPEGVKHWHGAAPGSMFQHLAIMEPVKEASTEWLEPVDSAEYNTLK